MSNSNRQCGDRQMNGATLPIVEALEGRQLLSVSLDHGLLTVSGTPKNDVIVVALTKNPGWRYVVDLNGRRSSFPARSVKTIRVLGRGGNNRIEVGRKGSQIKAKLAVNAGPGKNVVLLPKQAAPQGTQPVGEQPPASGEQPPASGEQPPVTPPAPPAPPTPPTPPQNPPPQDPPPTDPEEPLNVRPFAVYSNIRAQGTPDMGGYGLQPITVMYNEIYNLLPSGEYDFLHPDEAQTRQFARDAAAKGYIVNLDLEQWSFDPSKPAEAQANMQQVAQIIDWIRSEAPSLKLGLFSYIPSYALDLARNDTPEARARVDAVNELLAPLAAKVDILFPDLYPFTTDANEWAAAAHIEMEYARQYDKPVIPFIRPDYCSFAGPALTDKPLPVGYWRLMLDTLRQLSDGVVIWTDHYRTWDPSEPWWPVLRDFTNEAPRLPAAPMNLKAAPGPTSITISWTDNADNEGEYVVERSEDGVNFVPVRTLPADSTSWTDANINRSYEYRVRATNSFGSSVASNTAVATPYRLASSKTEAETCDAGEGTTAGWAVWNLGSNHWIRFDDVIFDRPVSTFLASVGIPQAGTGQTLEIHLDALDGPIIARLVLQPTATYWQPVIQSTNVSLVTGVHDLYLLGKGDWGTAALDWFVFQ